MNGEILTEIVLGIVVDDKKVLIVEKKKKETGSDGMIMSWVFPGGKIEEDEAIEIAVKREVLEETGYEVEVGEMISERRHPQFPVHITYWACTPKQRIEGAVIDDEEINQMAWVEPLKLKDYITTDIDRGVSRFLGIEVK